MNIASHKKTILIIVIVLLSFFGYWFFFISNKADVATTNLNPIRSDSGTGTTQYDKDFVSSLLGLNSVDLNVSMFSTAAFQALNYPDKPFVENYSIPAGRDNPFLPIGIDATGGKTTVVDQSKATTTTTAPANPATTTPSTPTTATTTTGKPIPKKF